MTKTTYTAPRRHFALSELSEEEIVSLLEHFPSDPESYTRPEGEPLPTIGEIRETESQLFTQIVSAICSEKRYPAWQGSTQICQEVGTKTSFPESETGSEQNGKNTGKLCSHQISLRSGKSSRPC